MELWWAFNLACFNINTSTIYYKIALQHIQIIQIAHLQVHSQHATDSYITSTSKVSYV